MSENKWPMNPVDPVENPKAAVKVGDHVKVTKGDDWVVGKTGIIDDKNIKYDSIRIVLDVPDNRCSGTDTHWVDGVELLPPAAEFLVGDLVDKKDVICPGSNCHSCPALKGLIVTDIYPDEKHGRSMHVMLDNFSCLVPPSFLTKHVPAETMNGCEHCAKCPAGAKKGDVCPERARLAKEKGTSDKSIMWMTIGVIPPFSTVKDCVGFVEKTCQNCGLKVNDVCNVVGDCSLFDHRYWTPKAEPRQDTPIGYSVEYRVTCDACGHVIMADSPPYACPECVAKSKRAEKAEKERDKLQHLADARFNGMESLVKERDLWKAKFEGWSVGNVERAMYDSVEKERNELKATTETTRQWREMSQKWADDYKELESKLAVAEARANDLESHYCAHVVNGECADSYYECDWCHERQYSVEASKEHGLVCTKNPLVQRVKDAEAKLLHLQVLPFKENAELTSLKEMLANQQRANENLAGIGEKMEPHVPKWARVFREKCQGCKKASRLAAMSNMILDSCPNSRACITCVDTATGYDYTYKLYVPRYTRSQRRAASVKGQLKAAIESKKVEHEYAMSLGDSARKMEQKGLEAVAKVAQDAEAKVNKTVERLDKERADHEAYKKVSVPLANAIPTNISKQEAESNQYGTWWYKVVFEMQSPVDFKDLVLYKKVKEEKPDGS